jgi:hypothetical protein
LRIGIDEVPEPARYGGNLKDETEERSHGMTAHKLIQLLEALPPNTRIPVEPAVISALKDKSRPRYVSEQQQDKIDGAILRRRSKQPKYVAWEDVKKRYGLR